tara:strand:- start:695 stop:886 length:192 start_codon:yes stop_codon:yes gene_type:complete
MTDTIDKRIKPDKAYKEYLKLISKYTHKRQKKYYHSKKSKKKQSGGRNNNITIIRNIFIKANT